MTKSNKFVFWVLTIVAWIIFIGLCVEAGGLLVNFIYSIFKPEVTKYLYQKLDLHEMYERSAWAFYSIYSLTLAIAILKAYLFYIIIVLVTKLDLMNPFNNQVSRQILRLSYFTFSIGLISYIAKSTGKNLQHKGYNLDGLDQFWADAQAFILMAAIIYVIAIIFARGVELQNENDLTV